MDMRVTSPTYLLSNTYPVYDDDIVIHHMDLYRLSEGEDLSPLNLDHVIEECISLIEWPSRLGINTPNERLDVTITIDKENQISGDGDDEKEESARILLLKAYGDRWEERLQEIKDNGYLDDLIVEYEMDDEQN